MKRERGTGEGDIRIRTRLMVGFWKLGYRVLFHQAAHRALKGRVHDPEAPERGRWSARDVNEFLRGTWERTDSLTRLARLDELPTWGNRHNVYLAVITTAAYRALLDRGTRPDHAVTLLADTGWKIYAWMLGAASLPFRLTTRDPGKRIRRTLRALMVFPFSAPGAPGYEAEVWTEGDDTFTYWTHCPPHTFVRRVTQEQTDRGELDAFRRSWCLYDWPGADILAGDGRHGHYRRARTLSWGDPVCEMCWLGRSGETRAGKL